MRYDSRNLNLVRTHGLKTNTSKERPFAALATGICVQCSQDVNVNDLICWNRKSGIFHDTCYKEFTVAGTAAPSSNVNENAVRAMIADMIEAQGGQSLAESVSEEQVMNAVRAVLKESRPVDLRIVLPDEKSVTVRNVHESFKKLVFMLSLKKHVYLYGPPGSGKSTGAMLAAQALGRKFAYTQLNPQVPDSRVFGYKDVTTGKYHGTLFRDLYENGGVFCFDEMDNASASLLVTLNAALENGQCAFPDAMVPRHPDFIVVGCGNTTGRGGNKQFPDRRVFDAAFAERFLFLFWGYDEKMERAVTMQINPDASVWVDWVQAVRKHCVVHDPQMIVSPRASFNIAELTKHDVLTKEEIVEVALFKGIDQVRIERILSVNPLPTAA